MMALAFGAAGVLGSPSAKADETITYFAHDIQNTPVVAMDDAGDVLWRKTVRPFGLEDRVGGPEPALSGSARIGFTGHEKDDPTGLIYMQARDYDPALGIFYSPDPEDIDPLSAFGPNRYIYADQNPYRYQDPSGRVPILLVAAVVAYKLWSVSETVDSAVQTAEMLTDPNTTTEDLVAAGAVTLADLALGKIGGKVVKAGIKKFGKPILEKAKKVLKGRTKGAKCTGGACSSTGLCFVAGTAVLAASGPVPIEKLEVGQRIETISGISETQVTEDWWRLRLKLRSAEALEAVVLRSPEWMAQHDIAVGASTWFESEEIGISGWAEVLDAHRLGHAPEAGPGRLILATTVSHSNDVYELRFFEGGEPIQGTGAHPLYSRDRDDWVRVRDLQVGERLQTAEGSVTIEALEKVRGAHPVYNLEVEGDHEYLVGNYGVRAHNNYPVLRLLGGRTRQLAGFADEGVPVFIDENLAGRGVADALRNRGFNVRTIEEAFGAVGIADSDITKVAEVIGGRVLTRNARDFPKGVRISVDERVGVQVDSLVRILKEGLN